MIQYKIIEKEKSGEYRNYKVYYIYRQILGIKFWVKSFDQYVGFFSISAIVLPIISLLFSCGCSDFQTFPFIKVYGFLLSITGLIFFFFKKRFDTYSEAEDHIKNIIRKKAKKTTTVIADFTFNSDASNITKTYNGNE